MKAAITCKKLSKRFGRTKALDNINISFEKNKIYGLLGRNGAGKTTLLKIISSQLFATEGSIEIYGENPYERENIIENICLVRENSFYPTELKVKDIISTGEGLYPNWDKEFASRLIREFSLDLNKKYKGLSKGMQSALSIIIGLASRAPITIYDEAYLGLDASMRQHFYDTLIEDYTQYPRTIIFSSHLIDECSSLFEDVIILDEGRIMLHENIDFLKERSFYIAGRKDKVESYLKGKRVVHSEEMGRLVSMAVFSKLSESEIETMENEDIEIQPMSLQRLFIYLTSKNGGEKYEQDAGAI